MQEEKKLAAVNKKKSANNFRLLIWPKFLSNGTGALLEPFGSVIYGCGSGSWRTSVMRWWLIAGANPESPTMILMRCRIIV